MHKILINNCKNSRSHLFSYNQPYNNFSMCQNVEKKDKKFTSFKSICLS